MWKYRCWFISESKLNKQQWKPHSFLNLDPAWFLWRYINLDISTVFKRRIKIDSGLKFNVVGSSLLSWVPAILQSEKNKRLQPITRGLTLETNAFHKTGPFGKTEALHVQAIRSPYMSSLLSLYVFYALHSSWSVHWTYISWEGNIKTLACKLIQNLGYFLSLVDQPRAPQVNNGLYNHTSKLYPGLNFKD